MRILLKSLLLSCLLAFAAPAFAQIHLSINFGPPAPRHEVRPRAPFSGAIWIGGFYLFNDNDRRYDWRPGRWEAPPAPEQRWVAPRYVRRGNQYDYYEGHWGDNGKHKGQMKQQAQPKQKSQGNRGGGKGGRSKDR